MSGHRKTYWLLLSLLLLYGCTNKKRTLDSFHFTLMPSGKTAVAFNNKITESDSVNVYVNEYMYNGSGVGIGDFNNDGLADIFFGGSMVSSRIYLNRGAFQFEDVTQTAGVQTAQWCTGISVVDINGDGFLDIYVCSSHSPDPEKRKNLLFVNNGPPASSKGKGWTEVTFTEQAAAYGLADTGFATQAAFFDYDNDGDLDMYLLNHRLYNPSPNTLVSRDTSGASPAQDRLYKNEGVPNGGSHPVFRDVTEEAGIKEDGYGLGLVITDVNGDNRPDVYVANDYIGNDFLWLNKGDGRFTNIIATALKHQSYNSMGADAADINNDGLCDLAVMDMAPETAERKKMMFNAASQEKYDMGLRLGYEPAFVRNMLQLNNGLRKTTNGAEPYYSEIGQLAGISETDWSWSVLMADFDNDGWKDLHITNGLAKDVTNNDYATFKNSQTQSAYSFGGNSAHSTMDKKTIALLRENLDQYGSLQLDNYFFHNNGGFTFSNTTEGVGLATPSVSNGAAYADLDNDGDLDLVVNNMNAEAFIWRNELRRSAGEKANNFLSVQLTSSTANRFGLGAKLWLYDKGRMQFLEQSPVRGFSSSVDYKLHFGIGNTTVVDSLKVQWPDGKVQTVKGIKANTVITLKQEEAKEVMNQNGEAAHPVLLNDITDGSGIDFKHTESDYFDFNYKRPLPQKYSQLGPDIATGDINGDGLTDFFVCGAANQSGKLFFQKSDGGFVSKNLVEGPKPEEDLGSLLFDADGDGDLDLIITGGSSEFGGTVYNHPRLYRNNGKGIFSLDEAALPKGIDDITKEVVAADYDGDGDLDLFIGGRLLPQKYPQSPRSYLLQNNGGTFTDVTKDVCPSLQFAGLITGAVFADFNNDKTPDLVINGEWMPMRFFANRGGTFTELTDSTGLTKMRGQWRSLGAADIDGDGDVDFVAGNLGWNNKFHIAPDRPLKLYAGDFDGNGAPELIPAYYIKNKEGRYDLFPALDRTALADQLPSIKKNYLLSADFACVTMSSLLKKITAKDMLVETCETTTTVWIENMGNGKFVQHPLPVEAQFAPVNAVVAEDLDGDGIKDLLLAGNEYGTEFSTGRYDASYGVVLKGAGKTFTTVPASVSGLVLEGDVRSIKTMATKKGRAVLIGFNNKSLQCFTLSKGKNK